MPSENYSNLEMQFDPQYGISREDFIAIGLLNGALINSFKLTNEEKSLINTFLCRVISNNTFHYQLQKSFQLMNEHSFDDAEECILEICFRTRHYDKLEKDFFENIKALSKELSHGE